MPRYQSRLFNWIDRSLPVQLGRRVRRFYNGFWSEVRQLPNYLIRDITTIARIATLRIVSATFYPIAKLGAVAKTKLLPVKNSNGSDGDKSSIAPATHNLESTVKRSSTNGLGHDSHGNNIDPNDYFQQIWQHGQAQLTTTAPLNSINADSGIDSGDLVTSNGNGTGKIVHQLDPTGRSHHSPSSQAAFLISNVEFAQLNSWQKLLLRVGHWIERTYILAEVELGITVLSELSTAELVILNQPNPIEQDDYHDRHSLNLANWRDRFWDLLPTLQPDQQGLASRSDQLDNSNHNSEQQSIDYIRNLIRAAIAYFFSRRVDTNQIDSSPIEQADYHDRHSLNLANWHNRFLKLLPPLQPDQQGLANRSNQLDHSNHDSEQQSIDYIRNLIRAAIAYFFSLRVGANQIDSSKQDQRSPSALPANNSSDSSGDQNQPWLTMAELFGDDNSHWPPLRHQSKSEPNAIGSSHRKANITNKPKQTNQNRSPQAPNLDHSTSSALADPWSYTKGQTNAVAKVTPSKPSNQAELEPIGQHLNVREQVQIDDFRNQAEQHELDEFSGPTQAWIEAKATFMGYVYSPAMQVIHWLDRLVAKLEKWFVHLSSKVWQWLKGLFSKS